MCFTVFNISNEHRFEHLKSLSPTKIHKKKLFDNINLCGNIFKMISEFGKL